LLPFSAESVFQFATPKKIKIKIYRTVILPVVLCGCEALSLTVRKEQAEGVKE
jgi:hypothetical protein